MIICPDCHVAHIALATVVKQTTTFGRNDFEAPLGTKMEVDLHTVKHADEVDFTNGEVITTHVIALMRRVDGQDTGWGYAMLEFLRIEDVS